MKSKIIALGHMAGEEKVPNEYFVKKGLDTSDQWIRERTGIKTRHFVKPETASSDLGYMAAKMCLANANLLATDIDLIITATSTPDHISFPSTACLIQKKLGCSTIPAFDISAACSGFCYALTTADAFIQSKKFKRILVIGVDCLSTITNMNDRGTCILFGDAAGAALLESTEDDTSGMISSSIQADGNLSDILIVPKGGSKYPFDLNVANEAKHYIKMDGSTVFKQAIKIVVSEIKKALSELNLNTEDVDYLVCHQANQRILDKITEHLNIPKEKCLSNIHDYGNTSAASIPLVLSEFNKDKGFKKGDVIVLAGFGAGFTWGISIIRW